MASWAWWWWWLQPLTKQFWHTWWSFFTFVFCEDDNCWHIPGNLFFLFFLFFFSLCIALPLSSWHPVILLSAMILICCYFHQVKLRLAFCCFCGLKVRLIESSQQNICSALKSWEMRISRVLNSSLFLDSLLDWIVPEVYLTWSVSRQ